MSNINDFVIENGVLKKYTGAGGDVIIPDGVTSIGSNAFYWCESLTTVTIPDGVTSIGSNAFSCCESLTTVTIPDSVTSIDNGAFSGCESLTTVTIPDSVTIIGNGAFNVCLNLTSINIPDSVTIIGSGVFNNCRKLTSINIPDSVTSIGDAAFCDCENLTTVNIPEGLTKIADGTFCRCASLKEITIPEGVAEVGNFAFANCCNLKRVVIKGADIKIVSSSFSECRLLEEMVFNEKFLITAEKRTPMLSAYIKQLTEQEAAYIWLYQDDKWLMRVQQQKWDMNNIATILVSLIADVNKFTPKQMKRIVEFVACAATEITSENVKKICDAVMVKDEKVGKKLLKDPVIESAVSCEAVQAEEEPVENFALSLLQNRPLHPDAFVFKKGIPYANKKDKLCTPQLLNILISEYLYLFEKYRRTVSGELSMRVQLKVPSDATIPADADKIATELDREALSNALEKMIYSCGKNYRPFMYAYARFATEESVKN